ncbi:MAG: FeoA family protein [Candidatus Bathycorpusculaceae bacterium]
MERQSSEGHEMPLTALRAGETGILTHIRASHGRGRGRGWGFEKRLMDMGLTPGTRVTVVKSAPFHGPLEIIVRGSRLALGRGMAERIFVEIEKK